MLKISRLCLGGAIAALITLVPIAAPAEEIGVSRADLPNYNGEYSLENATGTTIHYQWRWGSKAWTNATLAKGEVDTYSLPLGGDPHKRLPIPYVRFDRTGGDNQVTWREYKVEFHAVTWLTPPVRSNRT